MIQLAELADGKCLLVAENMLSGEVNVDVTISVTLPRFSFVG